MKILYLECNMGASGDMITAALYELLNDKEEFWRAANALGLNGVRVKPYSIQTNGVPGTHMSVRMSSSSDKQCEFYEQHRYMTLDSINKVVSSMTVSPWVRKKVMEVYSVIASAEAETGTGGKSAQTVHFHTMGQLTSIADITLVCLLMERIAPEKVIVSPICTGFGKTDTYYGETIVPRPSVKRILDGVPSYEGDIQSELCTRKGAALLKVFADSFGEMPEMSAVKQGCGIGKKSFEKPNCIRAFLGNCTLAEENEFNAVSGDSITELKVNIYDMTPRDISNIIDILEKNGAVDAYAVPVQSKKAIMGVMLCCLCIRDNAERLASLIFENTTATEIRGEVCKRYKIELK